MPRETYRICDHVTGSVWGTRPPSSKELAERKKKEEEKLATEKGIDCKHN